ncbi:hypothetical protein ACFU7D_17485 [Nocardioides sp. NPDC057577]|uniref:hypothetical protein n=1 Tax=Nocardioides sp. NPDC057577 TaxID=3346171 RepID=UPI00366BA50B
MTDLHDLFHQAQNLPYGAARTAALEAVVQRADSEASESTLPFEARIQLTYAYRRSGETLKSFVPFAWCTSAFDGDPARYADQNHSFLWAMKWQPAALTLFPEVPMDQAMAVLADMERRFRAGGHSMFAVHQLRLAILQHLGEREEAAEEHRLWGLTQRDDLSDCAACVPSAEVDYLTWVGRHEDAIRIGDPVLRGQASCSEQPQGLMTDLLPAYVATGRLDEAASAHRRAYQALRNDRGSLGSIGRHIEFLARTGNAGHALAIIERHVGWLDAADTPSAEMHFAAHASHALGRLPEGTAVRDHGVIRPAAELAAELSERARALAARFDARNGNSHVSELIDDSLGAEAWLEELPLSATARRAAEIRRKAITTPVEPILSEAPADDLTPDGLLDHFDARWMVKDREGAELAVERFEADVAEGDRTVHQAGRLLEARGLLTQRDGLEGPVELWRQALELLDGVDDLRALRCRGRIGSALGHLDQADEGTLIGEEPLRRLMTEDTSERRLAWAGRLGVLLMQCDRAGEVEQVLGTNAQAGGHPDDVAWTMQIRADAALAVVLNAAEDSHDPDAHQDGINRVAALYDQALAAGQSAGGTAEIQALWNRGRFRLYHQPEAEEGAADDLTEAAAQGGALGMRNGYLTLDLLQALLDAGRNEEAAHVGEEADRLVPDEGPERHTVHHLLAVAYDRLGQPETALEHIATRLVLLASNDPEQADETANSDRAVLHDWRGKLLDRLDRDSEAADAFELASRLFDQTGDSNQQLLTLRRAATSASWTGDEERSSALRERAKALLPRLADDGAHPAYVTFQLGGLAWDGARAAHHAGRTEVAIGLLHEAERLYRESGQDAYAVDAVVYRAQLGDPVPSTELQPVFDDAEEGSGFWRNAGYQLVDALRREGNAITADELQAKLDG